MKSKLNTTLPTLGLLLVAGVLISPNLSNAMDIGLNLRGDARVDSQKVNAQIYSSTTLENTYATSSDKFDKYLKNQLKTEVKEAREDFRDRDDKGEYRPGIFGRIWSAIVHRDKADDRDDKDKDKDDSKDHDKDNEFWLKNLSVDIDDNEATLSWSTSENATATVSYSTSTNLSNAITLNLDADDDQSIELENLEAGTTYYYKIVVNSSEDDDDDVIVKTGSFTTHENEDDSDSDDDSDEDGPLVLWLRTALVTDDSARILWITPNRSTSKVWIENDSTVNTSGAADYTDSTLAFFHSVTVDDLDANTTYHFKVASTDKNGNTTISTAGSFTTKVE